MPTYKTCQGVPTPLSTYVVEVRSLNYCVANTDWLESSVDLPVSAFPAVGLKAPCSTFYMGARNPNPGL